MIYRFLIRYRPGPWATAMTGLCYAILIVLIIIISFEPQAEFRYIGM
jgi:hypothetical protein